jgi:hypothetical protein
MELKWTADEVFGFLETEFPHALQRGLDYEVVSWHPKRLTCAPPPTNATCAPAAPFPGPP